MKYSHIKEDKKLSSFIKPMTAQPTDRPAFDDPDWIFEIKWDGYRSIAEVDNKENRLYSRNGLSFAKTYAKVFDELKKISVPVVLDGEIVVVDEQGRSKFQLLQEYNSRSNRHPILFYVFDCLSVDGKDTKFLPLVKRKQLVKEILPKSSLLRYCDHVVGQGKVFFEHVVRMDVEGIIAKRADSLYMEGKRSGDWLKIKHQKTAEAIIIGFTEGKGSRQYFGALVLAAYEGNALRYIGHVGTGFTDHILKDIHTKLAPHARKSSPVKEKVQINTPITWVDPVYVCNVKYIEITNEGLLRHPVFLGLRVDMEHTDVKLSENGLAT